MSWRGAISGMPFFVLTAFSDRSNELKLRQLGADDYTTSQLISIG
jgi:DNA-binding response OmpR family regulator